MQCNFVLIDYPFPLLALEGQAALILLPSFFKEELDVFIAIDCVSEFHTSTIYDCNDSAL